MDSTIIVPPDSTASALLLTGDGVKVIVTVLSFLLGSGVLAKVVSALFRKWRERQQHKRIISKLPVGDFHPDAVKAALRYYIEHEVSAIDPAGREMDRANLGPRESLFKLLDRTLYETHEKHYLLMLADSGMGKTTALLNYYAHNAKRKGAHPMVIFSLRMQGVVEKTALIEDKANKILLLDALDEDPTAISDHATRVRELLKAAEEFRGVVISCRSQFFLSTEEITKETGIARVHHRGLGEMADYVLLKFYLCPFSEAQISAFLKKRYPFPKLVARARARTALSQVRDLTIRPMLLTYLDDLSRSGKSFTKISDAYDEIVLQWVKRERPLVDDSTSLLEFSKKLAVDLYTRRGDRGGEQARATEIAGLAEQWGVPLERWQLTGRSLLTRDAADQFRFAHRSILEYLFVRSFFEGDARCTTVGWTDQMYRFANDIVTTDYSERGDWEGSFAELADKLVSASTIADVDVTLTWNFCERAVLQLVFEGILAYRYNRLDEFPDLLQARVKDYVWPLLSFAMTGTLQSGVQVAVVYNAEVRRRKHVIIAKSANSQQDWLHFAISELPQLRANTLAGISEERPLAVYVHNDISTIVAEFSADAINGAMYLFIQFPRDEVDEADRQKTLELLQSVIEQYPYLAEDIIGSPGILRLLSNRFAV